MIQQLKLESLLVVEGRRREMFRPFQVNEGRYLPVEPDLPPTARSVKDRNHCS